MSEMEEEMKVGVPRLCAPRAEPSSTGPSESNSASGRRGRGMQTWAGQSRFPRHWPHQGLATAAAPPPSQRWPEEPGDPGETHALTLVSALFVPRTPSNVGSV